LILLAVMLTAPTLDALPSTVVSLTLSGPSFPTLAVNSTYHGQVSVEHGLAPLPLAGRPVVVTLDGADFANTTTRTDGSYAVTFRFPARGPHVLRAWMDRGSLLGASSPELAVTAVVPPIVTSLDLATPPQPGFGTIRASWTLDDGGYPAYLVRVYRSVNGSPLGIRANLTGSTRSYVDAVTPNTTYTYSVFAFNSAGQGPATAANYTTPLLPIDALSVSAVDAALHCVTPPGHAGCPLASEPFTTTLHVRGNASVNGTAATGRLVGFDVTTSLVFPCDPEPCIDQAQAAHAEAEVQADGSYDVAFAFNWLWTGNAGDSATNPYDVTGGADGIVLAGSDALSIATVP
jgi:hypothetical protein